MRLFCAAVLLAVGFVFPVFSQKQEMTYEQYLTELNSVTSREKTAREAIAGEQSRIESLRQQISQLSLRITATIQEIYGILGITEKDVSDAEAELSAIKSTLQSCAYLSGAELAGRRQDIEQTDARLTALKAKRVSWLSRIAQRIAEVDPLMEQVRSSLQQALAAPPPPPAVSSTYTVGQNGAALNLSQIAKELYGDQYQWPRIYRANKAMIDKWYEKYRAAAGDPKIMRPQDFVLRGWMLDIPR